MITFLVTMTLLSTVFLCVLNALFTIVFRKRHRSEILSYVAVGLIELAIFAFVLLLRLGILTHVPYRLPSGVPFSRTEIGAAIAVGIGLFPAAYWHRTSVSQMRERMAKDALMLKNQESGVRIRRNAPGEWMN